MPVQMQVQGRAGNITNKTGEAGQKIGGLFGNITEKLKEAIGTK